MCIGSTAKRDMAKRDSFALLCCSLNKNDSGLFLPQTFCKQWGSNYCPFSDEV